MNARTVLHVLPHPGGGGETYVDALSELDGYHVERTFLARTSSPWQAASLLVPNAIRSNLRSKNVDLIHAHGEVAGFLSLPSLGRKPSVVTPHGLHLLRRTKGAQYRLAQLNLRMMSARAGRIICVSRSEYDDLSSFLPERAIERMVVIHNGVALPLQPSLAEQSATRTELGIPTGAAVALFVGKLDAVKEPLVAVQAIAEACGRGAHLVLIVAGDGPLRSAVLAVGGDDVRVLGFQRDVARLNAVADLFVLPSRREGLSYALLEAMSFGVVPIASDIPGSREAVGDTGILVPPGDVAGFATALSTLAAQQSTTDRLSKKARSRVEGHFRLDVMQDQTRAVYEELVSS